MFEKLKEYGTYVLLGVIALGALSYAYVSTTNQQKGAELHEATLDAMVASTTKSERIKNNSTVADDLLKTMGGKSVGQYKIDDTKITYVIGETYSDILTNKRTIDLSTDLEDIPEGKIRTILIAQPATQVNGEDINTINLNADKSISIGEDTYAQENLKNVSNDLKGYNISAIGYGLFENEKVAKEFRDTYFNSYEIYEVGTTGKYIILAEYNTSGGENLGTKINSNTENSTGGVDVCNEFLCLDANGVTMKAKNETICGNTYEYEGTEYYVACNKNDLIEKIGRIEYNCHRDNSLGRTCDYQYGEYYNNPNKVIITKVTDLEELFKDNPTFNNDISNWDTSNVTNMKDLFRRASSFNQNISKWNTSNVTNMEGVFGYASSFNQNISKWNTSNVTDMSRMFVCAENFNQNIGNWNVSNVTNMSGMFSCTMCSDGEFVCNFNNLGSDSIKNWNTSNLQNASGMFADTTNFNQPIGNWNMSHVTTMENMFAGSNFNQNIGNWNVSNVENFEGMFRYSNNFNNGGSDSINNWNTSNATNMYRMFNEAKAFNQPIGNWNVSNVTNMSYMFAENNIFNQPLTNWNTSSLESTENMFYKATSFNQPLNHLDVSHVYSMYGMFKEATSFNQPLNNWNTSNTTRMSNMFDGAISFNQDLSGWNVSHVNWQRSSPSSFAPNTSPEWTDDKKPQF